MKRFFFVIVAMLAGCASPDPQSDRGDYVLHVTNLETATNVSVTLLGGSAIANDMTVWCRFELDAAETDTCRVRDRPETVFQVGVWYPGEPLDREEYPLARDETHIEVGRTFIRLRPS